MLSMTVPIYQCEIAPGSLFVSIEYLCLNTGYALSAWVGYAFFFYIPHEISWHSAYIVQACLALILVIWTFFLPETPRWLIKNGFKCEGMFTLADLHAEGDIYYLLVAQSYSGIEAPITFESHLGGAMVTAFHPVRRWYHLTTIRPVQRYQRHFVFPP
jgi:MFS family permease